jgi:predicted CoA-binding protein
VLVFRPSEFAGAIVAEAIEIGAKVVWMQEGISDAVAAGRARSRGLEVVMDKCMMKEHKRMEIDTSI